MKTLTADQLKTLQNQGKRFALVNTLNEEAYEKTKIPGSLNIPLEKDDFEKRVEQAIGGKNQPIVVYCASSDCHSSDNAAQRLEDAGFNDVYDFEGGAKEWQDEGGRLASAQ